MFFSLIAYFTGDIANFLRIKRARKLMEKIKAGKASEHEKDSFTRYYHWFV